MGRKPDIIIERRYSNDPADWELAAEALAKFVMNLSARASRPRSQNVGGREDQGRRPRSDQ